MIDTETELYALIVSAANVRKDAEAAALHAYRCRGEGEPADYRAADEAALSAAVTRHAADAAAVDDYPAAAEIAEDVGDYMAAAAYAAAAEYLVTHGY